MKRTALLALALPLVFFATGCSHPRPYYVAPPPPAPGMTVDQLGYQDGFAAARHDVEANRPPAYSSHPRYRTPQVPPPAIGEYRAAFRDGYQRFLSTGGR